MGAVVGEVHKGFGAEETGEITAMVPLALWSVVKTYRS